MKKYTFWILTAVLTTALMACGKPAAPHDDKTATTESDSIVDPDDKTLYGIACDGSNDTLLIYLSVPYEGSDPDTINVLEASRQRLVIGRPRIGDKVAFIRNEEDSTVADMVIVIEALKGKWAYKVFPTLRKRADMPDDIITDSLPERLRNLLNTPVEYTWDIKENGTIITMGSNRQEREDRQMPVDYEKGKRYHLWHIFNGKLILTETRTDSLGNTHITRNDTAEFVSLRRDSLTLRYDDQLHGFYKKNSEH